MELINKIAQTVPYQVDTVFSPFKAEEFDAALDFLGEAGFTGVELAVAYPRKVDPDKLLQKLEARKLAATTLSTGQIYGLEGLFLSSFDSSTRESAADVVKGHAELSAKIGFPPVTIGLLRGKLEQGDKSELLANFREALLPCVEYAAKLGVILQIEPISRDETVLINTVAEALEFISSLGNSENVGILYDTYHSHKEDGDMTAVVRAAAGKITNVHLADSHRGLPGYGSVNFGAVSRALRSIGYERAYALETLVMPDREFINKNCYESVMTAVG